jgi:hypothetical protein
VDDQLLPPPEKPARTLPWRALGALFVPAAALAGGVGLQRFFEGQLPTGDALLRWLLWSSGAGLAVGAVVGMFSRKPGRWAAYGVLAPWAAAGLVGGIVAAVRPLRDALADRREASCRAEGRAVCSVPEFVSRCAEAAKEPRRGPTLLGEPQQKLCDAQGCTFRWTYSGPFRPETYVDPGVLLCSVVADAAGKGVRYALMPGSVVNPMARKSPPGD